jgi:integrase
VQRRKGDVLDLDELQSMLGAAGQLDSGEHSPATLRRAQAVRALRDDARMAWKDIAARVGVPRFTAFYLYRCHEQDPNTTGPRRAIIATLGLAGPRVTELCLLRARHLDLDKGKIYVRDAKTPAGVRVIDIRPRLHDELASYQSSRPARDMEEPAFPTRNGTARTKDTVRARVILPVLRRANELRAQSGVPPIRAHVTPHTLRRTYITFMLAAGFDLPYVQDQVGHADPSTTLRIYAQVIRRPDRDQLRAEARALFGERETPIASQESRLVRHTDSRRGHHPPQREGLER